MKGAALTDADADASSYDRLAGAFDRLSERHAAVFADRLVRLARVRPGEHVLDVGTGTGLVARRAARLAGPQGGVLGVDLSEGMLATARARSRDEPSASPTEFRRMDASALELPAGSRDVVLSLFALGHFRDPGAALCGMRRVLRPGGRIALGVGSAPPLVSGAAVRRAVARVAAAWRTWLGLELRAPGALDELLEARLSAPSKGAGPGAGAPPPGLRPSCLPALLRAAGFVRVRTRWQGHEARLEDPEEFWELQRIYSTRARLRLAEASEDDVRSLHAELLARARRVLERGGRLVYRSAALLVTAERPGAEGG